MNSLTSLELFAIQNNWKLQRGEYRSIVTPEGVLKSQLISAFKKLDNTIYKIVINYQFGAAFELIKDNANNKFFFHWPSHKVLRCYPMTKFERMFKKSRIGSYYISKDCAYMFLKDKLLIDFFSNHRFYINPLNEKNTSYSHCLIYQGDVSEPIHIKKVILFLQNLLSTLDTE